MELNANTCMCEDVRGTTEVLRPIPLPRRPGETLHLPCEHPTGAGSVDPNIGREPGQLQFI